MKVTELPAQIVVAVAAIETEGAEAGFTVIVIVEEVAGLIPL